MHFVQKNFKVLFSKNNTLLNSSTQLLFSIIQNNYIMKKLIITLGLVPILGISQSKNLVTASRYIQENASNIAEFENASASPVEKYHIAHRSWQTYDILNGSEAGSASEKLLYSFLNMFPLAEHAKWTEDTKGYFVSFTQAGILSKVAYDPQGDFIYALRYYKEENLPLAILLEVREKFTGKKIFGVTELSTPTNTTYYLKLEDAKNWYTIQVTTSGDVTIDEQKKKLTDKTF